MNKKTNAKNNNSIIAVNKKANHDFFLEQNMEAGLVLEGWEVKSIRAGRVQLKESHIIIKHGEAWLLNAQIQPLSTASTHINPYPTRTRKLLLNHGELNKLIGSVERKGYTIVATKMYWKNNRVKLEIALAKGKKLHDKRSSSKERDWQREKARILKKT